MSPADLDLARELAAHPRWEWREGVRVVYPTTPGGSDAARILSVTDRKRWIIVHDGLDLVRYRLESDGWRVDECMTDDGLTPWTPGAITQHASPRGWAPDLDDPTGATAGVLLRRPGGWPHPRLRCRPRAARGVAASVTR